ncbi:MAG: hypothetical protein A2X52_10805 [Candidatus Rokubacteria bacterium GWC2_70_16]|nr:MAG: hypothetical protein A2X52_10805 [Candidatus Rokubacteria bacterium GWC2_70_16]OGL13629.1 MAG: hypothetical protein A3K12_04950 [Candidatus Rokubacteria bacterium RIFCSPLOWO2_12_FULL_71_19]
MRGLLAAALTFLVFLGIQLAVFHFVAVRRKLYVMLWLWLGGYLAYATVFRLLPGDEAWLAPLLSAPTHAVIWVNGAVVYWFLFAGYYQLFNMADNSVGVRSLIELSRGPSRGMTLEDLKQHYSFDLMLGRRMERLVTAGYLERDGARYRCTGKGLVAARLLGRLKRLLNLGPGG